MSVGFNPTFGDVKRQTIEPWILHDYGGLDFYGATLKLIVLGWVRGEEKFDGLDPLIEAIRADGDFCREALEDPVLKAFETDAFFE